MLNRLGALGIGVLAALASALTMAAPAHAGGSYGLSTADLAAAQSAASSPASLASAGRFFAHTGAQQSLAGSVKLTGESVAVYSLNPEFVRGTTAAPVGVLSYVASTAVATDGRTATIWTTPSGEGWTVVNIASGDDEARFAANAAPGALLFTEPQTNAWYQAKDDLVTPLNDQARATVGKGMTFAGYQRLVHDRYAGKLPGSAYDKAGKAGGYGESGTQWLSQAGWFGGAALLMLGLIAVPRRRRV
jgi:hypothetical protein